MMSNTFSFSFEELPLLIEAGFEAGLVDGEAEITYHRDGEWSVSAIYLNGARERSKAEREAMREPTIFERKPVEVDAGTFLFNAILHRLEHEWVLRVQDALDEDRFEDRARAADDHADDRRDRMRESA
jgi:hypothetical protein